MAVTPGETNSRGGLPPVFKILVAGYAVSAFGDGVYLIAINWWVITSTGSAVTLGIVAASGALVFLLAAPISGRIIDRFGAVRLMMVADGWRMLVLGVFLLLSAFGADESGLGFFLPLIVLMALGTSISQPGVFTLIPDLVGNHDVPAANATLMTARSIATFTGPAVAGVLLGFGGVFWAVLFNLLTFAVSLLALAAISRRVPPLTPRTHHGGGSRSRWTTVRALTSNRTLVFALLVALIGNLALSMYSITLPLKFGLGGAKSVDPGALYGFTQAAFQAGMVIAGVLLARHFARRIRTTSLTVAAGLFAMAVAMVLVGSTDFAAIILPASIMLGVALMFVSVLSDTQLQIAVPDEVRGRVQGVVQGLGSGLRPIGILIATTMFSVAGAPMSFLVAGAIVATLAVLVVATNGYRSAVQPRDLQRQG